MSKYCYTWWFNIWWAHLIIIVPAFWHTHTVIEIRNVFPSFFCVIFAQNFVITLLIVISLNDRSNHNAVNINIYNYITVYYNWLLMQVLFTHVGIDWCRHINFPIHPGSVFDNNSFIYHRGIFYMNCYNVSAHFILNNGTRVRTCSLRIVYTTWYLSLNKILHKIMIKHHLHTPTRHFIQQHYMNSTFKEFVNFLAHIIITILFFLQDVIRNNIVHVTTSKTVKTSF